MVGSCQDEADPADFEHDHDHDHEHDHDHDHDHEGGPDRGLQLSLYQQIAVDQIRCLNEYREGAAKDIFKNYEARMDREPHLESDADEQLIIHVPFNAIVKLKSIEVRVGEDESTAPDKMKVWINREDLDFDLAESLPPTQEWDLLRDPPGGKPVEYETRMSKFFNVRSIAIFFPSNFGAEDVSRIDYIGLNGEWQELKKNPIVTVYELNANPADHPKTKSDTEMGNNMIQ